MNTGTYNQIVSMMRWAGDNHRPFIRDGECNIEAEALAAANEFIEKIHINHPANEKVYDENGIQRVDDAAERKTVEEYWKEIILGLAMAMDETDTAMGTFYRWQMTYLAATEWELKTKRQSGSREQNDP